MKNLFISILFTLAMVFIANAQPSKFIGSYQFGEDGGKTAGDTVIYVGHDLVINADGTASLTANGYQTSVDIIASTKMVGSKMQIIFVKYNPDSINTFETHKGGEILLTLEWKVLKKKKVLWTTFGNYSPAVFDAKKGGGIYFKKSK